MGNWLEERETECVCWGGAQTAEDGNDTSVFGLDLKYKRFKLVLVVTRGLHTHIHKYIYNTPCIIHIE